MFHIGIDISKDTIDCAYRSPAIESSIYLGQYSNTQSGFDEMIKEIDQLNQRQEVVFATIEPTGGYESRLVHYLLAQEWKVSLPNPKFIKDFASSQGRRSKSDQIDCVSICEFGKERKPKTHTLLSSQVEAMRDLLQRKNDLEKAIRAEKNRVKQYRQRPRQALRVNRSFDRILEVLEQELEEIETEIEEIVKNDCLISSHVSRLLNMPGIGPKTVHYLFVHLALCYTLTQGEGTSSMVVAMAGVDPEKFTSGSTINKPPKISKKGNKLIRQKLYMGALGGVSGDNVLRAFYQRLVGRGKPKKKALVAAMRKILVWAWAIFVNEVDFDPALAGAKS